MNRTCYSAINAIPHILVFNRKPNYNQIYSAVRSIITEDDIENYVVHDGQDDALIRDGQRQLEAKTHLCEELDVEVDMIGTIASSESTSLGLDETLSEYAGSFPES